MLLHEYAMCSWDNCDFIGAPRAQKFRCVLSGAALTFKEQKEDERWLLPIHPAVLSSAYTAAKWFEIDPRLSALESTFRSRTAIREMYHLPCCKTCNRRSALRDLNAKCSNEKGKKFCRARAIMKLQIVAPLPGILGARLRFNGKTRPIFTVLSRLSYIFPQPAYKIRARRHSRRSCLSAHVVIAIARRVLLRKITLPYHKKGKQTWHLYLNKRSISMRTVLHGGTITNIKCTKIHLLKFFDEFLNWFLQWEFHCRTFAFMVLNNNLLIITDFFYLSFDFIVQKIVIIDF